MSSRRSTSPSSRGRWRSWPGRSSRSTGRTSSGFSGCRAIVRYGVGLDNVDLAAAADLGIAVGNVPEYGHEEISNHAIALLLAVHRRLFQFDRSVRAGGVGVPAPETISRLSECTLGLVGLGRIGQRVARKAAAFDMPVIGFDPYLDRPRRARWAWSWWSSTSCCGAPTASRCTCR